MSTPFIGEIRLFAGSFAPLNWAMCNGQTMAIDQNEALYTLIGTTYGGDGQVTFDLPDLRSRVPVHQGTATASFYIMGQTGGVEQVTLSTNAIASHSHTAGAAGSPGTQASPTQGVLAGGEAVAFYGTQPPATPMSSKSVLPAGSSLPHDNRQPFQAITFIIALYGVYPSQN
jgi:microcystin-dependent protein